MHGLLGLNGILSMQIAATSCPHMQKVKVKGHYVQKLEWKQTDGWTEAIALPPMLTQSVKMKPVNTFKINTKKKYRLYIAVYNTLIKTSKNNLNFFYNRS